MIFSTLIVSSLLASALALPSSKERFDARVARRAAGAHLSHPRIGAGTDTTASAAQEYSPYWAGGVLHGAAVRPPHFPPFPTAMLTSGAGHLEEREREGFDLLQAAQETRETVVRTRAGQTIPVALTGSPIESADPQFQGNIFVARTSEGAEFLEEFGQFLGDGSAPAIRALA